ncbi:MAG: hypothetical protein A2Y65_11515 [Deltaproteobacteria bacterium RBG_13_52_11]|nr:MAG: hypothetical protein A2Y65_11515 [Deltaproteobacteria bacterium RBG_13_52_11]
MGQESFQIVDQSPPVVRWVVLVFKDTEFISHKEKKWGVLYPFFNEKGKVKDWTALFPIAPCPLAQRGLMGYSETLWI